MTEFLPNPPKIPDIISLSLSLLRVLPGLLPSSSPSLLDTPDVPDVRVDAAAPEGRKNTKGSKSTSLPSKVGPAWKPGPPKPDIVHSGFEILMHLSFVYLVWLN